MYVVIKILSLQRKNTWFSRCVKKTGIFHNKPTPYLHLDPTWERTHQADLLNCSREKVNILTPY